MKFFSKLVLLSAVMINAAYVLAQPKDPDYSKLTRARYVTKDRAEANALLVLLERKYPNNGYILIEKGYWQLLWDKDVNAALATLTNANKILPNNDDLLTLRAAAFFEKGLIDRAIADQQQAIQINPKAVAYYWKLGSYQFALKQYDDALLAYNKGIALNPQEDMLYSDAFAVYSATNRFDEAEKLFNNGLLVKGMDIGVLRCAYANLLLTAKKFAEAARQYQMAYDMPEPHMFAEDYQNAGVAYYKIKELDKAIYFMNIAIAKSPRNIVYLLNKAQFVMDKKEWEALISVADSAVKLDSNNAMANMYLAIGLKWGRNDMERSAAYERKAKELDAAQNKQ